MAVSRKKITALFILAAGILLAGCFPRTAYNFGAELGETDFHHAVDIIRENHLYGRILDYESLYLKGLESLLEGIDPEETAFTPTVRNDLLRKELIEADLAARECKVILSVINAYNSFPPTDGPKIPFDTAVEKVLAGLYGAADPHSAFMNRAEWKQMREGLSGQYNGIGIRHRHSSGYPVVIEVFPGGPSEGILLPGDVLTTADGHDLREIDREEGVRLLRGQPDSTAHIAVIRGEVPIEVEIRRRKVQIDPVKAVPIPVGTDVVVSWIKIRNFLPQTARRLEEELGAAKRNLSAGIVLDLRNNTGGLIGECPPVIDHFIDRGPVIYQLERGAPGKPANTSGEAFVVEPRSFDGGVILTSSADKPGTIIDLDTVPVIVLVNRFSASASELVAGALKDYGAAVLIGERTFGKGTVQQVFEIGGGRAVSLTSALFYLPSGYSNQISGVEPDIAFEDKALLDSYVGAGEFTALLEGDYEGALKPIRIKTGFRRWRERSAAIDRYKRFLAEDGYEDAVLADVQDNDTLLKAAVYIIARDTARKLGK